MLAARTGLSRLAALANLNNGKLLLLKTTPANCDTASQPEPVKLLSEARKNNATATTVCSKPTNGRMLIFGAAAKKTKREQSRNKTTD
ncbi:MAG: hypothetical protein KKE30_18075 [Gammaproteobacteria bacterium]|nr:hypothetical protein [Gammaproteobacteria bacterium]MBU1554796.1 hypothetical protein [Gammaproteobacteria bacterium]